MEEKNHDNVKKLVLNHIKNIFEEMEQDLIMSHQEKYALLEDVFESAADESELKIAFEQWYADHCDDIDFEHEVEELWDQAVSQGME